MPGRRGWVVGYGKLRYRNDQILTYLNATASTNLVLAAIRYAMATREIRPESGLNDNSVFAPSKRVVHRDGHNWCTVIIACDRRASGTDSEVYSNECKRRARTQATVSPFLLDSSPHESDLILPPRLEEARLPKPPVSWESWATHRNQRLELDIASSPV